MLRTGLRVVVVGCVAVGWDAVLIGQALAEESVQDPRVLYNGIRLPRDWPPRMEKLTREPMRPPYLEHPPAVIPIDVGRQLLVDDFLVAQTNLQRTFHQAQYHPASPVLKPDKPWEKETPLPTAMVFSDGVWYDPTDQLFKMWYMGGYCRTVCYAASKDGIHWEKPALDVERGTNVVWRASGEIPFRDSSTVWLDWEEKDSRRRFKLFTTWCPKGGKGIVLGLFVSGDGIHWSGPVAVSPPPVGDRTTVFYNPFRKRWVYSLRLQYPGLGRARSYREHPDPQAGLNWKPEDVVLWVGADKLDPHNPNPELQAVEPELYNLDVFPYESLLVGLFSIWQGDWRWRVGKPFQKRNEVLVGFSRDGFYWDRPFRKPLAGVNETPGAWNWGNVQSCGGGCLVVGDQLYFYVSGREQNTQTGQNTTGLALLRRDGFASMDAAEEEGFLTTRPVRFSGKYLFVNVSTAQGQLQVEILDEQGNPIEPFTKANCEPIRLDKTLVPVKWNGTEDLSAVAGKPVRFRFWLRNGSLYAFWVSPEKSGASYGYVAAGGPGFTGPIDTVGASATR